MDQTSESRLGQTPGQYDANYGNFQTDLYEQIRREAFGEDIGQNSWLTAQEQDRFLAWLALSPGKALLDVACGSGGPALRIAAKTGCSVVGVDIHAQAVSTACSLATQRSLSARADFRVVDAAQELPFPKASFDAITCIDAINHLPNRSNVLAGWVSLLKPGGLLLFTDPIIVTGALTNAEIAVRSSTSYYQFVPQGYDARLIAESGLQMLASEDVTSNMAEVAARRHAARAARSTAVRKLEGDLAFERQQQFLEISARIANERRLSRFLFVAKKLP
jgi:2-polyprenyl-3-methyl-5-hydroxy-6-metoxy-1,4-benzoquinol methylase